MSNKNKVAIIGGGIVGLYLATKIKKRGFEVLVFEKKKEISDKVCSGLISERIREFLPIDKKLIKRKIDYLILHFPQKDIVLRFRPALLAFRRKELNQWIARRAEGLGVEIVLDKEIKEMPKGFDKIIGCEGALSKTREMLGLSSPDFRLGLQYFAPNNDLSSEVEIWPKKFRDKPSYGFFWKIPYHWEIEYGAIGPPTTLREEFELFCQEQKIIFEKERIKAALIPQGLVLPKSERITLCGDAAGLTKPTSGGGIIWGFRGADILAECFPDFKRYRQRMRKFFLPKIFFGKSLRTFGYFLGYNFPYISPKKITIDTDLFSI
jgi:flavin-dependent dehydrogenase